MVCSTFTAQPSVRSLKSKYKTWLSTTRKTDSDLNGNYIHTQSIHTHTHECHAYSGAHTRTRTQNLTLSQQQFFLFFYIHAQWHSQHSLFFFLLFYSSLLLLQSEKIYKQFMCTYVKGIQYMRTLAQKKNISGSLENIYIYISIFKWREDSTGKK